ncbi:BtrH N-terminal domain-containing protein [Candidatus Uabimicrobium sp. HlEnr_7]|uniref:BtrH N-terminal domain-containing protein n=1 Tax=Candidatus Uabimicrobium helgolandensis TaxID=3095367 RepID=UPI0035590C2B
MIINNFEAFIGQHCETTATGSLLKQNKLTLSEPMLFGIGEGLSYIFWNMKGMDFPFIGGRVKPDLLTINICRNLGLVLEIKETSSIKKAWKNVAEYLQVGQAVGLKLDCYYLEYFSTKVHFAAHYVAIYGYDNKYAYLVDTKQQGGRKVKTSLKSLELARSEKGPMSSKNRSYVIKPSEKKIDLKEAVKNAIKNNTKDYLNPPIRNISYKGIFKTSKEIKKLFQEAKDIKKNFQMTATFMERAGTGGALFRNLYRDFLKESYELLKIEDLKFVHHEFVKIAEKWTIVANLLHKAGDTLNVVYINQASEILLKLSEQEKDAMEHLQSIF